MKRASRTVAAGVAFAALGFASTEACTAGQPDDVGVDTLDAGADTSTRPRRDSGPVEVYEPPPFTGGPEGWELFTDYDPVCGIYYPTDAKYLPDPIRWEPCSGFQNDHGLPGPDGMDCRMIALDRDGGEPDKLSLVRRAEVVGGKVRLLIGRHRDSRFYRMVVDIDGPVHQALLATGGCAMGGFKMRGGNVMYRMYDRNGTTTHWPGGAIGGPVDSLRPRAYLPKGHLPSTTFSQVYDVGAHYFIESIGGNDTVYSIQSGLPIGKIVRAPEDKGMIYADYRIHDNDAFWVGDNGARTAIKVWNPADGVKTLVGWPGDNTRAAGGIAVDGVDMVWFEAVGRSGTSFARYDVWTAKYTTDASVVEATKRRLLTNNLNSTFEHFVVGCGYAAVKTNPIRPWGQSVGFLVIRLSDAMTWAVEAESLEQRNDVTLGKPLAITCNEIVVEAWRKNDPQVARIRLDSLGPGTPAE